jgi:hypothetical protein
MDTRHKARLLVAVFAAAAIGLSPVAAMAKGTPARAVAAPAAADRHDPERDKDVKYEHLPANIRETLDKERGHHEVKQIHLVHRDGRSFYRAIIDTKGEDKVVRINEHGQVLSAQAANDDINASKEARERDRHRDVTDKVPGEHETLVRYENAPAAVRKTLDRERGQHQLKEIMRVNHGASDEFYRAVIVEKNGAERVVRISPGGQLVQAGQVTSK